MLAHLISFLTAWPSVTVLSASRNVLTVLILRMTSWRVVTSRDRAASHLTRPWSMTPCHAPLSSQDSQTSSDFTSHQLRGAQRVNGGFMTHLTPGDAIQVNVPVNITISTVSCVALTMSQSGQQTHTLEPSETFLYFFFLRSIWWLRSLTFSRVETDRNWYVTLWHMAGTGSWCGNGEMEPPPQLSAHLITKSSPVFSIKT